MEGAGYNMFDVAKIDIKMILLIIYAVVRIIIVFKKKMPRRIDEYLHAIGGYQYLIDIIAAVDDCLNESNVSKRDIVADEISKLYNNITGRAIDKSVANVLTELAYQKWKEGIEKNDIKL